ncbi:hypothetical protein LCGC14_1259480 [marine sediment metagenome]|uniref:Uncharacterized protein n=1 Tax=marine sediment metagenome TaxID=412755 RepID=A0A0F9LMH8_9ZZZZ
MEPVSLAPLFQQVEVLPRQRSSRPGSRPEGRQMQRCENRKTR